MASILKVDKIRGTGLDSDSISIDGSGNITTTKTPSGFVPAGGVIQTVQNKLEDVTRVAITSSSFQATNITATITPTSTSSKVLIMMSTSANNNNTNNTGMPITIYRNGSTDLSGAGDGFTTVETRGARSHMPVSIQVLDSPATTSATTYTMYTRSNSGSTVELPYSNGNETAVVILQEIAG
jgi:hypothetical protein